MSVEYEVLSYNTHLKTLKQKADAERQENPKTPSGHPWIVDPKPLACLIIFRMDNHVFSGSGFGRLFLHPLNSPTFPFFLPPIYIFFCKSQIFFFNLNFFKTLKIPSPDTVFYNCFKIKISVN